MTESEIRAALTEKGSVKVFAESPDYLVLLKGPGIPSAPLANGGRSAFEVAASRYPEILSVQGRNASEGGLIHRIDSETAGLLLIARTQPFYDMAMAAQKDGRFIKYYTAFCSPACVGASAVESAPAPHGASAVESAPARTPLFTASQLPYVIESRFRPLGKKGAMVKPVFENDAGRADRKKAGPAVYRTRVLALDPVAGEALKSDEALPAGVADKNAFCMYRARCSIEAGFRHQVRSHLAACGYPVIGDNLYGNPAYPASQMLFFASALEIQDAALSVSLPEAVLDAIAASACSLR